MDYKDIYYDAEEHLETTLGRRPMSWEIEREAQNRLEMLEYQAELRRESFLENQLEEGDEVPLEHQG